MLKPTVYRIFTQAVKEIFNYKIYEETMDSTFGVLYKSGVEITSLLSTLNDIDMETHHIEPFVYAWGLETAFAYFLYSKNPVKLFVGVIAYRIREETADMHGYNRSIIRIKYEFREIPNLLIEPLYQNLRSVQWCLKNIPNLVYLTWGIDRNYVGFTENLEFYLFNTEFNEIRKIDRKEFFTEVFVKNFHPHPEASLV